MTFGPEQERRKCNPDNVIDCFCKAQTTIDIDAQVLYPSCFTFQVKSKSFGPYSLVVMPFLGGEEGWLPIDLLAKWTVHSPAPPEAYQTLPYGELLKLPAA